MTSSEQGLPATAATATAVIATVTPVIMSRT